MNIGVHYLEYTAFTQVIEIIATVKWFLKLPKFWGKFFTVPVNFIWTIDGTVLKYY